MVLKMVSSFEKASEKEYSEDSDIELEDIPLEESLDEINNHNPINTIKPTVLNLGFQLQEIIDRVLELSTSEDKKNVYKYNFIFDTGASVHVITNKEWFSSYKKTNKLVSWGEAKSLKVQGEGHCEIQFSDTNKKVSLRKCYYIPEFGINIIGASALPQDILWIGGNKNLIIMKNKNLITKGQLKQGLYFLPAVPYKDCINITMDLLHQRFAHIKNLQNLIKNTITNNSYNGSNNCSNCEVCAQAELPNKRNKESQNKYI